MIRLNIEDLKAGMVLAQAVRNPQGVLLLDAGAKITKKNIRIFKSWGVIEVFVKGEMSETKTAGEPSLAGAEAILKKELEAKFSGVLKDPVMAEILNAASKQLIKNLSKSEHETENSRSKKNHR